jgi:hypothetical protein
MRWMIFPATRARTASGLMMANVISISDHYRHISVRLDQSHRTTQMKATDQHR